MSDSQKQRPGATPIKNPLLSASVTGLTFEDFPNKPLILPAAPPILHIPVPNSSPMVTPSSLLVREPKSLVTVGSSSVDTENLDEINLNAFSDDNQLSDLPDSNANPLLEQSNQGSTSESILSQAASSFSVLPSVASNVISTFSKRITAISSRETTPTYDQNHQDQNGNTALPKLDIQPSYIQQQQTHSVDLPQAPPPFYAPPQGGTYLPSAPESSDQADKRNDLLEPEPPKFYTPSDVPSIPLANSAPPTNIGGQNNFRFSSKKKLYAPIPGLSNQNQKPTTTHDSSAVTDPISYDYSHKNNNFCQQYNQLEGQQYPAKGERGPEERKGGTGLFSKITNLAPTGVLQNITGLVQSAAGSLSQTIKPDSFHQSNLTEVSSTVAEQPNNCFTAPPPPPPTNYFVPPSQCEQKTNTELTPTAINLSNISQTTQQPPLFNDQQQNLNNFESSPLYSGSSHYQSNFSICEPTSQGIRENLDHPSFPAVSLLLQNKETLSTSESQTQIPFYNPCDLQSPTNPNLSTQPRPQPARPSRPPSRPPSHPSSSYHSQNTDEPSVVTFFNTTQQNPTDTGLNTVPSADIFNAAKYSSDTASQVGLSVPVPPTADHTAVPPSGGHTSYRLQKGTKLYKNPLTPQEIAPVHVTPDQIQTVIAPQTVFSTQYSEPHSIPLFTHPSAESKSYESIQSDSLLDSSARELKTISSTRNAAPFTVPLEKTNFEQLKPNEPNYTDKTDKQDKRAEVKNVIKSSNNEIGITTLKENIQHNSLEINPQLLHNTNSYSIDNKEAQLNIENIEPFVEEKNIENQEKINFFKEESKAKQPIGDALQKPPLSIEPNSEVKNLTLPPNFIQRDTIKNPYRKGSATETSKSAVFQPTIATFFSPKTSNNSTELNFFATPPATERGSGSTVSEVNFFTKTPQCKDSCIQISESTKSQQAETVFLPSLLPSSQLVSSALDCKNSSLLQKTLPPPVGFESSIKTEPAVEKVIEKTTTQEKNLTVEKASTNQDKHPEVVNRFLNYFNQTDQAGIPKDPSTFFDSFAGQIPQQQPIETTVPSVVTNEEQRIQNFFNNPPPKDASAVGDLNYDLVHSGLGIKNLHQRSLTPISNLVEPPSSVCSEFSEINSSTAGQKTIINNLSITENENKFSEKEEIKNIETSSTLVKDSSEVDIYNLHYKDLPKEILEELRMANLLSGDTSTTTPSAGVSYKPAIKHWFHKRFVDDKQIWVPFSHYDSALLETSLLMQDDDKSNVVAVEGGRYDVNLRERKKMSVYWDSEPIEVRRCSWFYKTVDSKYIPYEEETAELLENEYKQAAESGVWHKKVILNTREQVEMHGPTVIFHLQQQQNVDAWGGTTHTLVRPRIVRRDLDDFKIEQGESRKVDHLLFMVHGIGSACDLKLRSVEEVVGDFRTIASQLVQSHYKNSTELGLIGRVEVLPISWHSHLHSIEMGIDEKLRMITLESIPKLRNFTNDTLLDILFYTSPTYCQKIMNSIVSSLNTLYLKYRKRHPEFNGGVSLAGHSLGSLILFDLLCHQNPVKENEDTNLDQLLTTATSSAQMDSNQLEDKQISYTMGPAGTGQPFINYDQLIFSPKKFFALGSPIGVFATIRGIDKLGLDFRLPTCPGFYNIFHPYDPVAYRIEALVNPDLSCVRPVLIPHHKGRKRMHLELKETMTRVSTDLKNRFFDKFKTTLDSVNIFGTSMKSTKESEELMEKDVDKVIQMQMQLEHQQQHDKLTSSDDAENGTVATPRQRTDSTSTAISDDLVEIDFPLGKLNDSKRIDYVLQEAPLEFINEYIFALSSHVCYWDSEDTILFVMKEIYSGLGVSPDSQVPQQTMTIERPSSSSSS